MSDTHKHCCPKCRYVWEHENADFFDSLFGMEPEKHKALHTCPNCGHFFESPKDTQPPVWDTCWKYRGKVKAGGFVRKVPKAEY